MLLFSVLYSRHQCNIFTQVTVIKSNLIINNQNKAYFYTAVINNNYYQSPLKLLKLYSEFVLTGFVAKLN